MKTFIVMVIIALILVMVINWNRIENFLNLNNNQDNNNQDFEIEAKISGPDVVVYLNGDENGNLVSYRCNLEFDDKDNATLCENCFCRLSYDSSSREYITFYLDSKSDVVIKIIVGLVGKGYLCDEARNESLCKKATQKMEHYRDIMRWHDNITKALENQKSVEDRIQ